MTAAADSVRNLGLGNAPWCFWRVVNPELNSMVWQHAERAARLRLRGLPAGGTTGEPAEVAASILTEAQFGPKHFRLSPAKRVYYSLRPFLPASLRPLLRRISTLRQQRSRTLGWPIEDRYVRYQSDILRRAVTTTDHQAAQFL